MGGCALACVLKRKKKGGQRDVCSKLPFPLRFFPTQANATPSRRGVTSFWKDQILYWVCNMMTRTHAPHAHTRSPLCYGYLSSFCHWKSNHFSPLFALSQIFFPVNAKSRNDFHLTNIEKPNLEMKHSLQNKAQLFSFVALLIQAILMHTIMLNCWWNMLR